MEIDDTRKLTARQHRIDLQIDLPMRDVLRMLAGPNHRAVPSTTAAMVSRLMDEVVPHLRVQAVYTVCGIQRMTDHELVLTDTAVFNGAVADFLKPARRVAVFVATIGEAVDALARRQQRLGFSAESFTLHAIGSAAAEAAIDAVLDHLWEHEAQPSESLTPAFCPGYCGLDIQQQRTVFSILDARPIGVTLLPSLMMKPLKSISGLVGIGPAEAIERYGFPCERCQVEHCRMRRIDPP